MNINWRKINRATHRDLGYFFTGMVIIYALSGIALNHRNDWNPNYIITHIEEPFQINESIISRKKETIVNFLKDEGIKEGYKSHFSPNDSELRVFLNHGSTITFNFQTEKYTYENIRKRPVFFQVNFLHYNPGNWWKWFSDIFSIALIIIAITGLFVLKGKNGITRRGAWLTIIGITIPLIFLFIYL